MPRTNNIHEAPRVTIGITAYNAEHTISRAIASALFQDWDNVDLLIVDDCSADNTVAVIEKAILGVPYARLIRHETNRGAAAARNTILDNAKGEYVIFFDDDDESLPERLRIQYERLNSYEHENGAILAACFASGVRRYPNGYEMAMHAIGSQPTVPKGDAVADYLLYNGRKKGLFFGSGTPTCSLMARLSTFKSVSGFDGGLRRVEDVDFAVRLALAGGHFIGCPDELFVQHATLGSDKTPLKNLESELFLVEKHAGYLRNRGKYGYARDWFKIRYYHFSRQRFPFLFALGCFIIRHPISASLHLLRSAPNRIRHENKMLKTTP